MITENIKDKSLPKDKKGVEWLMEEIVMLIEEKEAWKEMFERQCKKTAQLEVELYQTKSGQNNQLNEDKL